MTMIALAHPPEAQFVDGLRARYEGQGFTFRLEPDSRDLPDFLGSYRPDAIARKPGQNVAIELKQQNTSATQDSLQRIRKLFDGHPDWRLDVVFMGTGQGRSLSIAPASPQMIRLRIDEVQAMLNGGQHRAAFVMAWSLLEAALHSTISGAPGRPYTPGSVLQTLAMNGYIEPPLEKRMRPLIDLRNRIVHGDVDAEPTQDDVDLILSAISETLEASAA